MEIVAVLAMTESLLIGARQGLPWSLPEDMRHFREITNRGVVIMGRNTYLSLPERFRPLPGRRNIVLSMSPVAWVEWYPGIDELLSVLHDEKIERCFVIGGASVYDQFFARGLIDRVELTIVHGEYSGDISVREFRDDFAVLDSTDGESCSFLTLERL